MNTIDELQASVVSFARARNWQRFHDPKNLTMALASEVGELNEILRWVANEESDAVLGDRAVRRRFQRETADVAILLLLLCERTGIDVAAAIREKLAINDAHYPIELSRDRADRPDAAETGIA